MTVMSNHLLIIDAMNLIHRVFKGGEKHDTSLEDAVQRLESTCPGSIRRALRECKPTHAVMVYEGEGSTWRHAMYPAYKFNRELRPTAIAMALPEIRSQCQSMGILPVEIAHYEADDIIATIARQCQQRSIPCTILSTDKDFAQLLSPLIRLRNHFAGEYRDADWLMKKYQVRPEQFRAALALMGDRVDNIPGVEGIGPKKAAQLLAQYNTLGQLIENKDNIKGKIGENLRSQVEALELSYELVGFLPEIKVGFSLKDARLVPDDAEPH
jgi:5'-3' exonuclease